MPKNPKQKIKKTKPAPVLLDSAVTKASVFPGVFVTAGTDWGPRKQMKKGLTMNIYENYRKFETTLAGRPLVIETGKFAGLANGSCMIRYGETCVLACATARVSVLGMFLVL